MSWVTTIVIFGSYIPDEARTILREGYWDGERQVSFGELSALGTIEHSPWDFWKGSKGPEADVFGGAFNHLDYERLRKWLARVPWHEPVAVIWAGEETNGFNMEIFGTDPK